MTARKPCTRCLYLRWFLAAVVLIAALRLVAPQSFGLVEGLSSLEAAVIFVGGLGVVAVLKALRG